MQMKMSRCTTKASKELENESSITFEQENNGLYDKIRPH